MFRQATRKLCSVGLFSSTPAALHQLAPLDDHAGSSPPENKQPQQGEAQQISGADDGNATAQQRAEAAVSDEVEVPHIVGYSRSLEPYVSSGLHSIARERGFTSNVWVSARALEAAYPRVAPQIRSRATNVHAGVTLLLYNASEVPEDEPRRVLEATVRQNVLCPSRSTGPEEQRYRIALGKAAVERGYESRHWLEKRQLDSQRIALRDGAQPVCVHRGLSLFNASDIRDDAQRQLVEALGELRNAQPTRSLPFLLAIPELHVEKGYTSPFYATQHFLKRCKLGVDAGSAPCVRYPSLPSSAGGEYAALYNVEESGEPELFDALHRIRAPIYFNLRDARMSDPRTAVALHEPTQQAVLRYGLIGRFWFDFFGAKTLCKVTVREKEKGTKEEEKTGQSGAPPQGTAGQQEEKGKGEKGEGEKGEKEKGEGEKGEGEKQKQVYAAGALGLASDVRAYFAAVTPVRDGFGNVLPPHPHGIRILAHCTKKRIFDSNYGWVRERDAGANIKPTDAGTKYPRVVDTDGTAWVGLPPHLAAKICFAVHKEGRQYKPKKGANDGNSQNVCDVNLW